MSPLSTRTGTRSGTGRGVGPHLLRVLVVVGVLSAVGAVAGAVWEWVWTPPAGVAFDGEWLPTPAGPDYVFAGTGWYVVVALAAGILATAPLCLLLPGREVTTLLAVLGGSALAAWVMAQVGHALGPADPRVLSVDFAEPAPLPGDLTLAGFSAYAALPLGAVLVCVYLFLVSNGPRERIEQPTAG